MTSEKISMEQLNEFIEKRINKYMEGRDPSDRPAVESGLYKAWVEILAEQDPTEIAERLNFIQVNYYLVKKTSKKRAEIVDSSTSRSIIEYNQCFKHKDCFISQKIEFLKP